MSNVLFSIFPSENFIDLGLYQYGWEQCDPAHSFGPAARTHYLFHYVISGTGNADRPKFQKGICRIPCKKRTGLYDLPSSDLHLYR